MNKKSDFKHLHRNIFLTLFFIPAIFTLLISVVTSAMTFSLYRNSFTSSFQSQISLLSSRFEMGYSQFNAQL